MSNAKAPSIQTRLLRRTFATVLAASVISAAAAAVAVSVEVRTSMEPHSRKRRRRSSSSPNTSLKSKRSRMVEPCPRRHTTKS